MGSVLDFTRPLRARMSGGSSWGVVTELVDLEKPRTPKGKRAVVCMGRIARTCLVEDIPAVGDLIRVDVPGVVERVRTTPRGLVLIYARPAVSGEMES